MEKQRYIKYNNGEEQTQMKLTEAHATTTKYIRKNSEQNKQTIKQTHKCKEKRHTSGG